MRNLLEKEIPIITADIRSIYKKLDKKFHLQSARIPIEFSYDQEQLGAYTPASINTEEHFTFSLLFIGYAMPNPLSREDRVDLYLHEYAHFMCAHMEIPSQYRWQVGKHGSAWKYCCSLIGAVPTEFYKAGEALLPKNYDSMVKKTRTKASVLQDQYRMEQAYRKSKGEKIHFRLEQEITHPAYGKGIIREIIPGNGNVRLAIDFPAGRKMIDQQWLYRQNFHKKG